MSATLLIASDNGQYDTLEYLISNGVDINLVDNNGRNALINSSQKGHDKIVSLLIKSGADIHHVEQNGRSALMIASENGHDMVVDNLIKCGADINHEDSNGWSALMIASQNGHDGVVDILIKSGADIKHVNQKGFNSLMIASDKGHDKVVGILIKGGADVNYVDNNGWNALMIASQYGHDNVVDILIKGGADILHFEHNGWNALMIASQNGQVNVVDILIRNGADIYHVNDDAWSALMIASQNGQDKVVDNLIKCGEDINYVDKNRWNALMIASKNGHDKVVDNLIKCGADINRVDNNGWSALMIASQNGYEKVVHNLIISRADKICDDLEGMSALMMSLNYGHGKVANILIKVEADIQIVDNNGWDALMIACQNGHENVVEIILNNQIKKTNDYQHNCKITLISPMQRQSNLDVFALYLIDLVSISFENGQISILGKMSSSISKIYCKTKAKLLLNFIYLLKTKEYDILLKTLGSLKEMTDKETKQDNKSKKSYLARNLVHNILKMAFDIGKNKINKDPLSCPENLKTCSDEIDSTIYYHGNSFDLDYVPMYLVLRSGLQFIIDANPDFKAECEKTDSYLHESIQLLDKRLLQWKMNSDRSGLYNITHLPEELHRPKGVPNHHSWWLEALKQDVQNETKTESSDSTAIEQNSTDFSFFMKSIYCYVKTVDLNHSKQTPSFDELKEFVSDVMSEFSNMRDFDALHFFVCQRCLTTIYSTIHAEDRQKFVLLLLDLNYIDITSRCLKDENLLDTTAPDFTMSLIRDMLSLLISGSHHCIEFALRLAATDVVKMFTDFLITHKNVQNSQSKWIISQVVSILHNIARWKGAKKFFSENNTYDVIKNMEFKEKDRSMIATLLLLLIEDDSTTDTEAIKKPEEQELYSRSELLKGLAKILEQNVDELNKMLPLYSHLKEILTHDDPDEQIFTIQCLRELSRKKEASHRIITDDKLNATLAKLVTSNDEDLSANVHSLFWRAGRTTGILPTKTDCLYSNVTHML